MASNPVWSAPPNHPADVDRTLIRRRRLRLWGGIVWVALTALSMGFLAPFTFSFAAAKRRSVVTVIAAVVFTVVLVGLFVTVEDEESIMFDVLLFGNLVVSISAALILRPHVFPAPTEPVSPTAPNSTLDPASPFGQPIPTPPLTAPPTWTGDASGVSHGVRVPAASWPHVASPAPEVTNPYPRETTERRQVRRAEARAVAHRDPATAIELGIGRPDRATHYDDGGLIDLNRAPREVLAQLPGIGAGGAQALVLTRAELGPFVSVADAMIRADIPPRLESEISEYAVVF